MDVVNPRRGRQKLRPDTYPVGAEVFGHFPSENGERE